MTVTTSPAHTLFVEGAHPRYPIHIKTKLLDDGAALAAAVRGKHVLIVSDSNVAPLYADALMHSLQKARATMQIAQFVIPAGEASKTLAWFSRCLDALAALGARRDACVIALGGGVVGDLAGFAAACWMRGIDIVQCPTSLLAMVDSSIGGKTAVDSSAGKNLIGAFHFPPAAFIDTHTLQTLPQCELLAGFAEVIKYGAIADIDFLNWLGKNRAALLARNHAALHYAILRSCQHKSGIVADDPLETGKRALLNFGHTFAHAIEAAQGFSGLNHGQAVAVGMVAATRLAAHLGMASAADADALLQLLDAFGLPTRLPEGIDAKLLLERMRLDKKANAQGIRFVLWQGAGRACMVDNVADEAVLAVLAALQ